MKIQFTRPITVDMEKSRLNELWDKAFSRWDELQVEDITITGDKATIRTSDGDYLFQVPINSFVEVKEKRSEISL